MMNCNERGISNGPQARFSANLLPNIPNGVLDLLPATQLIQAVDAANREIDTGLVLTTVVRRKCIIPLT